MMLKAFYYNGLTSIGIESHPNLLKRIAENLEYEIFQDYRIDCLIKINQAKQPVEIVKDKRFDYLSINREEKDGVTSIRYIRYNTPVRTIHQINPNNYIVDTNVSLDEDAGLICIRKHLNDHPRISNKPLLHASLIELGNQGILIPGDSREGKTTLSVYLLQEKRATFISDENVILDLSNGQVYGPYIPRTIRVRFKTISESKLEKVLSNISLTKATQYIDSDAIERIISSRSYNVEAGLAFSRKSFYELLGSSSKDNTLINLVIFPKYTPIKKAVITKLTKSEGVYRLGITGLAKKQDADPKELGKFPLTLTEKYYNKMEFLELKFSGFESLVKGGVRL